jgi:hydroxyacylglutathione hydrolase
MIANQPHDLKIIPIPAFKDNYIWLIHNNDSAAVVDPGDANVVIETLSRLNLKLRHILITHHHHDHIDGVESLLSAYPNSKAFTPKQEHYDFKHTPIDEGSIVYLPEFNLQFNIIDLPGHTLGHIAFYSNTNLMNPVLFCGDTLFGAGCGRLFEGTAEQMLNSLQKLALLPADTRVYCAHEYTLHNINFALSLEPNNIDLNERLKGTIKLRHMQQPSIPSTIKLELATNPFLRCHSNEIQTSIGLKNATPLEVFRYIREQRNHY